uniref:ParB N-terminal domain-containing protein n=1 Tax=Sphingobium aquiterrae TaxID=2038656 RepID=UPI0030198D97
MNAVTETEAAEPVSGVEIFVPLAKLKKSPYNARKVPHGEAAIEALAASMQHKGLIQNLVVEPETKEDGTPTGYYLVTAGEGRRLAMLLRAKRVNRRANGTPYRRAKGTPCQDGGTLM